MGCLDRRLEDGEFASLRCKALKFAAALRIVGHDISVAATATLRGGRNREGHVEDFAPVIIWNVSIWTSWATRAWVSETAHPATKATIKAAVLTANNVLAI
jgi:hypothetical protein